MVNDKNRDLFTYKNSKIENLFEVKTSCDTQSLCTALGQLLIYSIPLPKFVKLYAVLPIKLKKDVSSRFMELGVEIIYFNWVNGNVKFENLSKKLYDV